MASYNKCGLDGHDPKPIKGSVGGLILNSIGLDQAGPAWMTVTPNANWFLLSSENNLNLEILKKVKVTCAMEKTQLCTRLL